MIKQQLDIINKLGLHARAAAKFVNTANLYEAAITVSRSGRTVNGKSIMGLMMLAAPKGSKIEVTIDGPDEEQAYTALALLLENKFDEEQD